MNITAASEHQYEAVRKFYHSLIEDMKNSAYDIGWKKDIYPSPDFLKKSIEDGNLYIGFERENIAAAMVLNSECNDGYQKFNWQTNASQNEIAVIHALGVHPKYGKKGYAKEMVRTAIRIAENNNRKAVRLDVLSGNVPAERLYTGLGFKYMDTLKMYYDDTGLADYKLYEFVIRK